MIRITGGAFRSRLLSTPKGTLTKPTMDKVRAGIFNALGPSVNNARVLDLFAGSGSYGLESLSRGAKEVIFVDKSHDAISAIKENVEKLQVSKQSKVVYADALMYLKNNNDKYNLIFVDPPYALKVYEEIVDVVIRNNLLENGGALILESERDLEIPEEAFKEVRFYKYGLAKVYLLKN